MNRDKIITISICTIAIIFAAIVKLSPIYFYNKGQKFLKQENYLKAYENLKKAYTFDKNNKNYRYYYVETLLNIPPTLQVQKELFEISSDNINDSAQDAAENRIIAWRNNIIRNIGDNYIEQAPMDKGIIRWDTKKFPLKINFSDNSGINLPSYYKDEVMKAFSQWQSATGFIKFAVTENPNIADIKVKVLPLPNDVCNADKCRYVVGFTNPNFKGNILKDMTITLYSTDPNGNFFSDKELYNTILHEIGHALGIMGHSYSSDDLMYMASESNNFYTPYRSSFQYLSAKDINTIKLLYKLEPVITNNENIDKDGLIYTPIILGTSKDISSRKLKEAQNYVKNAPELASGYIDMGIAYAELNRLKDAINAMHKAYSLSKTDNEKYLILYNIAALYMNYGDLDKALIYAEETKKLSDTDELKDLISNIKHAKLTKNKPFKSKFLIYNEE